MTKNTVEKIKTPPSDTTKKLTFDEYDKFQRKPFAEQLTKAITTFSPFYDEAFVLSLNAPFGRGKSTFLKMWQNMLESKEHNIECIYINAWEHDFEDAPIIPILASILEHIDKKTSKKDKATQGLKNATLGTFGIATTLGNDAIAHFTGANIKKAAKEDKHKRQGTIKTAGEEVYKEYNLKQEALTQLKGALKDYSSKLAAPLVIFVDELDRARPSYSIEFLETIKHIFGVRGLCFVLAVDRQQLEHSVAQLYGKVDFENYYLRFVTREARLSEASLVDVKPFVEQLAVKFIDEKKQQKINFGFSSASQDDAISFISIVSKELKLEPRQIEKLFRVFTQFMAVETNVSLEATRATILLIALEIKMPSKYIAVGTNNISIDQYWDLLEKHNILQYVRAEDMLSIILNNDKDRQFDIITKIGDYRNYDATGRVDLAGNSLLLRRALSELMNGLNDNYQYKTTVLQDYYNKLEHWSTLIE